MKSKRGFKKQPDGHMTRLEKARIRKMTTAAIAGHSPAGALCEVPPSPWSSETRVGTAATTGGESAGA